MSDLSGNAGFPTDGTQPAPWAGSSTPTPGTQYPPVGGGFPGAPVVPVKKKPNVKLIVGIVVVVVIVVGLLAFFTRGNVAAKDIQVGACFTDTNGDTVTTIKTVDCSQTHDSEVFLNQAVTSSTYPTDDEWTAFAQEYCVPAFATYVGIDFNSSSLDLRYMVPDSTSWGQGDKTLTCYATDPNGGLTSSVKGSGK